MDHCGFKGSFLISLIYNGKNLGFIVRPRLEFVLCYLLFVGLRASLTSVFICKNGDGNNCFSVIP